MTLCRNAHTMPTHKHFDYNSYGMKLFFVCWLLPVNGDIVFSYIKRRNSIRFYQDMEACI